MEIIRALIGDKWRQFTSLLLAGGISAISYAYGIKVVHDTLTAENNMENILSVVVLITVSVGLSIFSGQQMNRLFEEQIHFLRVELSRKVMKTSFETIERKATKMAPILTADVNTLTHFVKLLPEAIISSLKIFGILVYMLWLSWQISLFIMLLLGLILVINFSFLGRVHVEERKAKEFNLSIYSNIQGMITGIKELVLNKKHHDSYIERSIAPKSKGYAQQNITLNNINLFLIKSPEWIAIMAIAGLVMFAENISWFSEDVFIKFFTLMLFILPSMIVLISFFSGLKRMRVAVEKINELGLELGKFSLHQEENTFSTLIDDLEKSIPKKECLIALENVAYSYRSNKPVFTVGPISLKIFKNEVLFISGGNGTGKTTFSKLLTGLYTPEKGQIIFGNQPITSALVSSYRNIYSAIFADSYVFDDLTYLKDSPMWLNAKKLTQMLDLEDKISLDRMMLLDVNLSFGQRGRLNLLRTILEDKPVILFDEWAANQDLYFKKKYYRKIIPELRKKGKTIIVISHDSNYYDVADRIIEFSQGKVFSTTIK
jgi:putative ATP-binding cassette transporter